MFAHYLQKSLLTARRFTLIRALERRRQSRDITMIHRQEVLHTLGGLVLAA